VFISAMVSSAQNVIESAPIDPTDVNKHPSVEVVYTGRLYGYFRVPSKQSGTAGFQPCRQSGDNDSQAAQKFLANRQRYHSAILVGAGDNFAPRREARFFDPPPANPDTANKDYRPRNKEHYEWDWKDLQQGAWVVPEEIGNEALEYQVHHSEATIRADNVACFLAEAGFKAIVPGKHDFYFGPERVRQLARLLASMDRPNDYPKPEEYVAVQMLGANLVIKTSRVEASPPTPDQETWEWPVSVMNLQDGKSVYPWFSSIQVRIMDFTPDSEVPAFLKNRVSEKQARSEDDFLEILKEVIEKTPKSIEDQKHLVDLRNRLEAFRKDSVHVCLSGIDRRPITPDDQCLKDRNRQVFVSGNAVVDEVAWDTEKSGRFSAVTAGENYQLILEQPQENQKSIFHRLRFSVFRPFFYFPHRVPWEHFDPDPYVYLKDKKVAIFGVVDSDIGQHIGLLNFSWLNVDDQDKVESKLKTEVSAQDPVESLREQLRHFKWKYYPNDSNDPVLRVLLAQMSPQRAKMLAAQFPEFQIVVTAADEFQGTSEVDQSTVWSPERTKSGTFVAVPSPYFYLDRQDLEGLLHFGTIRASQKEARKWRLEAEVTDGLPLPVEKHDQTKPSQEFKGRIEGHLRKCLPANAASDVTGWSSIDQIRRLALCAMRESKGADVALIQRRDFYDEFTADDFPIDPAQETDPRKQKERIQQILDRIIWKGDLLTLLYVPGSALKKALEQSDKFKVSDSSFLSLADEEGRGLDYLGIYFDKETKQYLVDEMPLDEKKIYAVATSDYIGAGDTGYPDLAAAALNPRIRPSQYPAEMDTISSIVCRRLFDSREDKEEFCVGPLASADRIAVSGPQQNKQPSFGKRLLKLEPFKWPPLTPLEAATSIEQRAQHHPIWTLALRNFSLGFLNLSNNLTDAQIGRKFAGVSTSGVNAKNTHAVTVALDTRLSRSSHRNEFFVSTGIDFSELSTGDVAPKLSQLKNRWIGELGFVSHVSGGRSKDRFGIVLTLHAEGPLQRPFTTFTLGTKDSLKIIQNRSVLLLPRTGLRWQNGANFFEVGGQAGEEIHALSGYRFNTQGAIVECLSRTGQTFADCITNLSTPPMALIMKDSVATAILQTRPRAGLYWKYGLSIPFGSKVKYELNQEESQEADFFFNFHADNASDTKFLDRSKHSLKFAIWPSFSIGPTLRLLLYQNKVNRDFLFQKQLGFEANFTFNLFNGREKVVQLRQKP